MTCTSKRSKMLSYVAKHSKQHKTTKPIKLQWISSIGCQNDQNKAKLQKWSKSNDLHVKTIKMLSYVAKHSKQRKTTKPIKLQWIASIGCQNDQNKPKLQKWSESNDLQVYTIKKLSYVAKHSKQRKTTKPIKFQWIASIRCQNDQNEAKLQKWPKYNNLHFKTIKNVELRRKTFKTTQNYKTDQITMNCIDWMSKRSKQS